MELFWLKGFGSTSIADILSRSQVNSGSLYYFFPGKQDADRGARGLSRRHWSDAPRARLEWRRRSDRARVCAPRELSPCDRRNRVPIWLPDRQSRATDTRARPTPFVRCWRQIFGLGRCRWKGSFKAGRRSISARARELPRHHRARHSTSWKGCDARARASRDVAQFDRSITRFRDNFKAPDPKDECCLSFGPGEMLLNISPVTVLVCTFMSLVLL